MKSSVELNTELNTRLSTTTNVKQNMIRNVKPNMKLFMKRSVKTCRSQCTKQFFLLHPLHVSHTRTFKLWCCFGSSIYNLPGGWKYFCKIIMWIISPCNLWTHSKEMFEIGNVYLSRFVMKLLPLLMNMEPPQHLL